MKSNTDYDELLTKIKPAIIAVEGSDKILNIKKKQAKMVGAKLVVVTKRVVEYSTSGMIDKLLIANEKNTHGEKIEIVVK